MQSAPQEEQTEDMETFVLPLPPERGYKGTRLQVSPLLSFSLSLRVWLCVLSVPQCYHHEVASTGIHSI